MCCTFTGIGDGNDITGLLQLQAEYPDIEWGVLILPRFNGNTPGYPTIDWIKTFVQAASGAKKALHLCEESITDFLGGDTALGQLADHFDRIQLNIFQQKWPVEPANISMMARNQSHQSIILPYNPGNRDMVEAVEGENIEYLFDRSGGAGKLPDAWPDYIPTRRCGYAGGLGPQNIAEQLPRIHMAANRHPFWIDMESRIKDDDGTLSLSKVREVADFVAKYNF